MGEREQYVPLAAGDFAAPATGRYSLVLGPGGWQIRTAEAGDPDAMVLEKGTAIRGVYTTTTARPDLREPMPDPADVLAAEIGANDAGAATIEEFLIALLRVAMSMKRPFGFSGWRYELYRSLARARLIPATFDQDGEAVLASIDMTRADALLDAAAASLGTRTARVPIPTGFVPGARAAERARQLEARIGKDAVALLHETSRTAGFELDLLTDLWDQAAKATQEHGDGDGSETRELFTAALQLRMWPAAIAEVRNVLGQVGDDA